MAFNRSNTNNVVATQDDSWKATAFLNFYVPSADGSRRKIGAISLKDSKSFDAAVIQRLTEGGTEAVQALMNVLEVDFHRADQATPVSAVGF